MHHSNFSMCEYYRRIDALKQDGFRLAFDTSHSCMDNVWCALLIHHNGTKIRLTCHPQADELTQKTNGITNYEYHPTQMC
mgnify:FL=1